MSEHEPTALLIASDGQAQLLPLTDAVLSMGHANVGGYTVDIRGTGWTAYISREGLTVALRPNPWADEILRRLGWRGEPLSVKVELDTP